MIVENPADIAQFDAAQFQGVPLAHTEHSKTMLVCLEPEQAIPVHHPGIDLTLVILEGRATLVGPDGEAEAGAGAVLHAEAGQPRGLKAHQRTLAIATVAPPPGEGDHDEVHQHLAAGTWR